MSYEIESTKRYMRDTLICMMITGFVVVVLQAGTILTYINHINKMENRIYKLESKIEQLNVSNGDLT